MPKDEGRDFGPATLRIFEAGHRLEDVVAAWLKGAGFDPRTHRRDGGQFGFSVLNGRFGGHIDDCLGGGPVAIAYARNGAERRLHFSRFPPVSSSRKWPDARATG